MTGHVHKMPIFPIAHTFTANQIKGYTAQLQSNLLRAREGKALVPIKTMKSIIEIMKAAHNDRRMTDGRKD